MSKILIAGGTGSFGMTYARRLIDDPTVEEVRIFSRDEKKQHDMRQQFDSPKISYLIGDVRDRDATMHACQGVDFVFHAAALKQVPTGEFFPMELVKTNILGTENIFDSAQKNGVKKVVLLSTDKAVYPINVMGMSKAIAEKLMIARSRTSGSTVFCGVRYGNVMASRGSVIPLFIDQITAGKNITITDPMMTRFMLSLEHAIDLVALATTEGQPGDIFIKKAPAATVEDVAHALLEIFGASNKIEVVGTRKGEKLHEALASKSELVGAVDLGDYYCINNEIGLEYEKFYERGTRLSATNDYTSENTTRLSRAEVVQLIGALPYVKAVAQSFRRS